MEFDDIFELLEAVRSHQLGPKETILVMNSITGSTLGYVVSDRPQPPCWVMPARLAKQTANARGTREAVRIRELLGSHMGRKQLLEELRAGTLEYGIARPPPVSEPQPDPGPQQCTIPGL